MTDDRDRPVPLSAFDDLIKAYCREIDISKTTSWRADVARALQVSMERQRKCEIGGDVTDWKLPIRKWGFVHLPDIVRVEVSVEQSHAARHCEVELGMDLADAQEAIQRAAEAGAKRVIIILICPYGPVGGAKHPDFHLFGRPEP